MARPAWADYLARMTAPYRLHYAPDNASLVIRLALEELGLPYTTVLVDRAASAQRSPPYLTLNPNGLIPVLETPQGPIFETGAILLWLADTHGALAPGVADPLRGDFLKWLFFASNTLHADLRLLFYPHCYAGSDPEHQTALQRAIERRLVGHLHILETLYASAPEWLTPDAPTILDLYIACQMRWMALYPVGRDHGWFTPADLPALMQRMAWLEQRPSVRAAAAAEGLGAAPLTVPSSPIPPDGSAA